MTDKKRFKATIAGRPYTIVGNKSNAHLNAVVEMVNQQLQQLQDIAPELSTLDRSILMAVNAISDQLTKEYQILTLEDEIKELKAQLEANPTDKGRSRNQRSQKR